MVFPLIHLRTFGVGISMSLLTLFARYAEVTVATHTNEDVNVRGDARASVKTGSAVARLVRD